VAKAEENLVLRSEEFDNATAWSQQTGIAVPTANSTTAPNGTTTADTIVCSATTASHRIGQGVTLASATYVVSVYAKASTHNFIQFSIGNQSVFANFDITAGSGVTGTNSGIVSSAITDVGNGWYRCSMVYSNTVGNVINIYLVSSASAVRNESWTALGTEAVFLWGAQVEQRSSVTAYTATTTAPITNYIPALQSAASGVARFEHNPVTGESLGLEIEEQRTNLLERSEEFDNAYWIKNNSSITANSIIAPNGTLTAEKFVESSSNAFPEIVKVLSTLSGQHTWTVFAKKGERQWLAVDAFVDSARRTWFNLDNGTVGTSAAGNTATITPVGNGWYRCTVSRDTSGAVRFRLFMSTTDNGASYQGDGFSGIYIWGAQLEAGSFATSYIPTVASQVTRSADSASMTGTNFSSWYRADEGTIYSESAIISSQNLAQIATLDDGTTSNLIQVYTSGSNITNQVNTSGTAQAINNLTVATVNTYAKNAFAIKVNDFSSVANGGAVTSDTSGIILYGLSRFGIGSRFVGATNPLNGTIKKIAYYPKRLTNAELQGLTTV
jgi:hypothetical protein